MSGVAKKAWTTSLRLMGNLLPLLLAIPWLYLSYQELGEFGLSGKAWRYLGLFVFSGIVGTSLFGMLGNNLLKDRVGMLLHRDRPFDKAERWFVGFAKPSFKGLLDPHQDVGYLILHEDSLEFFGETERIMVKKDQITRIRTAMNIHTWLGLGAWLMIEGTAGHSRFQMRIEPRMIAIVPLNWPHHMAIKARLQQWLASPVSP
jgi:hypothetical protein